MQNIFSKYGILKNALDAEQIKLFERCLKEAKLEDSSAFESFKYKYLEKAAVLSDGSKKLRRDFVAILEKTEIALNKALPKIESSLFKAFEKVTDNTDGNDSIIIEISESVCTLKRLSETGAQLLSTSHSDIDVEYAFRKAALSEFKKTEFCGGFFAFDTPPIPTDTTKSEILQTLQNADAVISALNRSYTAFEQTRIVRDQAIRECALLIHGFISQRRQI